MDITSWIASQTITIKFLLGIGFGLFIWVGLRYLIYLANKGYKKEMQGKRKPTELERLKTLAED